LGKKEGGNRGREKRGLNNVFGKVVHDPLTRKAHLMAQKGKTDRNHSGRIKGSNLRTCVCNRKKQVAFRGGKEKKDALIGRCSVGRGKDLAHGKGGENDGVKRGWRERISPAGKGSRSPRTSHPSRAALFSSRRGGEKKKVLFQCGKREKGKNLQSHEKRGETGSMSEGGLR